MGWSIIPNDDGGGLLTASLRNKNKKSDGM